MPQQVERSLHELERVLHDAVSRLNPAHVLALVAHPSAVLSALAAAAGALSQEDADKPARVEKITGAEPRLVETAEVRRRISARKSEGATAELLTTDELAARVGLKSRQSVANWLKKGKIIGWQGSRRGYVFPVEQFDERNRPLPGLNCVVDRFNDGYAAWIWLTTPRPSLDGAMPLTLLARGEADQVALAAQGDRHGDFA